MPSLARVKDYGRRGGCIDVDATGDPNLLVIRPETGPGLPAVSSVSQLELRMAHGREVGVCEG